MNLPFSHDAFLDVFGAYNSRLWPAVVLLWVATAGVGWRWFFGAGVSRRVLFGLLAAHWAWSGVAYHWLHFRVVNPAATLFAALFVLQAVVFLWLALESSAQAAAPEGRRRVVGGLLGLYGLIYPVLGLGFGLQYPRLPLFAVPCPTTLVSAGVLVAGVTAPRAVAVVPLLWAAIGSSAAFALGIRADLALVVAAALLALDLVAPSVLGRPTRGSLGFSSFAMFLGVALAGCAPAASVKLWSGAEPDFINADISPDGRYLSHINWSSGDLQLVDLNSGQARDLTGHGYDAGGYAWTSAFSTDGRRIAVAWYREALNSHELRIIDVDGGASRVLVPAVEGNYYVDPVDWSASDKEVLVAMQVADRTWRLDLVAVDTGTSRTVKTLGWQTPGGGHDQAYPDADLSADGRYIAYDYPPQPAEPTRDIFAVAVDGGRETTLVSGRGSDRLLGWLPDGSGILFYSDRSGTPAVWRLRVRDGSPVGEPQLVHDDVRGLLPLGFARDGYAYGVPIETEQVHIGEVGSAGTVVELPRPVSATPLQRSLAGDWSPDGSRLAYVVHEPLPNPVETLVIASASGQVERTIPLTPALHASNGTFRWSAEERVFFYAYERGRDGIYEMNLGDGKFRRLATPDAIGRAGIKWFDVGPDSRTIFMIGPPREAGGENDLVAFDAATGGLRVIGTARAIRGTLAVSPDGTHLAYLARDEASRQLELRVVPITGTGKARIVYRAPRGRMGPPVAWTPDGSRLLFELQVGDGDSGLWSVSVRGGEPLQFLANCCRENDVWIHPGGRRMAVAAGAERGEIRLLRGL